MDRIRNDSGLNIHVVVAGDKDQSKIADKHDIEFVPIPNKPVSRKFQKALSRASKHNPSSVMVLGSDDIISTNTAVNLYNTVRDGYSVSGLDSIYFYSTLSETRGKLIMLTRNIIFGAGKIIRGDILDKLDWVLWNKDANCALDAIAQKTLNTIEHSRCVSSGMLVDVKTRMNMNKFDLWNKKELPEIDVNLFYDMLSEAERIQLKIIIKNQII